MRAFMLCLALASALPLRATDFPMECGDLRRSNAVTATAMVAPLDILWETDSCVQEPNDNPLILGSHVVTHSRYQMGSLNLGNGVQEWVWHSGPMGYVWSDPGYDADRGLLWVSALSGALAAVRLSDGQPQWSTFAGTQPNGGSYCSPTYLNGQLLYCDGRGSYNCMNPGDHSLAWHWDFSACQAGVTPGIDGGLAYVAGSKGELACFRLSDGATQWRVQAGSKFFISAVTLDDTRLYVMANVGQVQCRSRADGSLLWSYQTDSYEEGNLALHGGVLFCTSDDRYVHAVDCATGSLKWKTCHAGNFARSSPFVCGGQVFTSGCTGVFYGDDEGAGSNQWDLNHGAGNSFNDWAYADGNLIGMNMGGQVFCFRSHCPACTATASPTVSASATATVTPTGTVTPTQTPSSTATPSITATDTATATPSSTPSATPSGTPSATPTATATASPSASPTATASMTPTATTSPSATLTATPTISPTRSATPTASPTASAQPTAVTDAPGGLEDPGRGCYNYPNPSHGGDVWVVYRVDGPCKAKLRVFQSAGAPAAKVEQRHEDAGVKRCQVPCRGFAPGVYFYKVDLDYDDGRKDSKSLAKFVCNRD